MLLFNQLPVVPIWIRLTAGLAWVSPLTGVYGRRCDVEDSAEDCQRAREAITAECRDLYDTPWWLPRPLSGGLAFCYSQSPNG